MLDEEARQPFDQSAGYIVRDGFFFALIEM